MTNYTVGIGFIRCREAQGVRVPVFATKGYMGIEAEGIQEARAIAKERLYEHFQDTDPKRDIVWYFNTRPGNMRCEYMPGLKTKKFFGAGKESHIPLRIAPHIEALAA